MREAKVHTRSSCDCRPGAYVKGWWHVAKCLGEMQRWEMATTILERRLNIERKSGGCGRELRVLLEGV